jgi:hypothetical protein
MRKLILITRALYQRDFVAAGAFDALDDDETYYLSSFEDEADAFTTTWRPPQSPRAPTAAAGGGTPASLQGGATDPRECYPNDLGALDFPLWRMDAYREVRELLLASYRFRSRTARVKLNRLSRPERWRRKLAAAPGVRQWKVRRHLRRTGLLPELYELLRKLRPDVVIAPWSGTDVRIFDAIRSARALGIPTLALMYNWDNLSSKAAFVVEPDYLGVVGEQSAQHAWQIHRIPPERVRVLGSPYIDNHFRHVPNSTESPFPFPYVLFAGCYEKFDELTAIEQLEQTIEANGLDVKVVYLPHPRRRRRKRPDFVDERRFEHVVIEPRVRERYLDVWERDGDGQPRQVTKTMTKRSLPLDYYPALLENAEFVICPLSTMMLEAAIFGRRVLVIAYHDGIHAQSPAGAIKYLHFEGVDRVDNFEVCRDGRQLGPLFTKLARDDRPPRRLPKDQMDYWVYHDERPFTERLAAFVEEIGRWHGAPESDRAPALSEQSKSA